LILLIECKKANPDFVKWIFFPKYLNRFWVPQISTLEHYNGGVKNTEIQSLYRDFATDTMHTSVADEARETRGNYLGYKGSDKTKTANTAISDAAKQIALATRAIGIEELVKAQHRRQAGKSPLYANTIILPVIVTSANLFICEFS